MTPPVFIGDEVSAACFALAGVQTLVPSDGNEAALLERARREAELVLITAEAAARVPEPTLRAALEAGVPAVGVVPDVRRRSALADPVASLRRQLGLGE